MPLLLLFIIVPIFEIYLFIQTSKIIGAFNTISFIFLTAIIGVSLLKKQGKSTIENLKRNISVAKIPVKEVFDGACLVFSGALLLTPGFFTDGIGFLLLIPNFRKIIRKKITQIINNNSKIHTYSKNDFYNYDNINNKDYSNSNSKDAPIDVDYKEIKD
jgi:UPF0716 protein FxsA